ncbi:acyl-CoA-like ligand-binding transcription factor [Streptomyces pseudoechinosporeus]
MGCSGLTFPGILSPTPQPVGSRPIWARARIEWWWVGDRPARSPGGSGSASPATSRSEGDARVRRVTRQLTELVAERTDAERDTAPRLMADVVSAALRTSVEMWAAGDTDVSLPDLVRESLTQLRAGPPRRAYSRRPTTTPSAPSHRLYNRPHSRRRPPAGWPDDSVHPR